MVIHRAIKIRLYPTGDQKDKMDRIAGVCRFVYNLALEQRIGWHSQFKRATGTSINYYSQSREVAELRKCSDWIAEAPAAALQQAMRDLESAYEKFFRGINGFPSFRRKGSNDSFRFPDPKRIKIKTDGKSKGMIRLPKIGWVKSRGWRALPGSMCNVTVSCRSGQWFASIQFKREAGNISCSPLPSVGIDLGVSIFAALSNGEIIAPVNHGKKSMLALKRAQRGRSRKINGSANSRKASRRVAKIHMRIASARKDFLHKTSTTIAKSHGVVVMEALRICNMTSSARGTIGNHGHNVRQKAGLNRAILDQGWGAFRVMLAYKLSERGGQLIEVSPAYTSQKCAKCGHTCPENRRTQSIFCCVSCGYSNNADINAAVNILWRAGSALKPVEGHRYSDPMKQEPEMDVSIVSGSENNCHGVGA